MQQFLRVFFACLSMSVLLCAQGTNTWPHLLKRPLALPLWTSQQTATADYSDEENFSTMTRFNPCINGISSRICVIDSKIDATCGATAIHQSDVDTDPVNGYIITQPGHYCCAQNLVGGSDAIITIAASDVLLDLNGYELTAGAGGLSNGIIVDTTTSHTGITITNGFIVGLDPALTTTPYGIGVGDKDDPTTAIIRDIQIRDISVRNFGVGVLIARSQNVFIDSLRSEYNGVAGAGILSSFQAVIQQSQFLNNSIGLSVTEVLGSGQPSHNVHVDRCEFDQLQGFACMLIIQAECIRVSNCNANNSGTVTIGFGAAQANGTTFDNCQACGFSGTDFIPAGFLIASADVVLRSCLARDNEIGFALLNTSTACIIQECIALNNINFGFLDVGAVQNLYENNTACENNPNYSSNIIAANFAPVNSPAAARGYENVDCSSPDITCDGIRIYTPGYTIMTPGKYCVATNLTGATTLININASDVELDINGHELAPIGNGNSGININAGLKDITIKNGFIVGDGSNSNGINLGSGDENITIDTIISCSFGTLAGSGHGIFIPSPVRNILIQNSTFCNNYQNMDAQGCQGITLRNSHFDRGTVAIGGANVLNTCNDILIQQCTFNENITDGLNLGGDVAGFDVFCNALIENTSCNNNGQTGCNILTSTRMCHNVVFQHCSFNDNGNERFAGTGVSIFMLMQNVRFQDCTFNNNKMNIDGFGGDGVFIGSDPVNVTFNNCQANYNDHDGFILSCSNAVLENCMAGVNQNHGFNISGKQALLQDCFASANLFNGFNIQATDACLLRCTAKKNGTPGQYPIPDVGDGFFFADGSTGLVKESIAVANAAYGFEEAAPLNFQYYANNACDNAIANYSPAIDGGDHAPVTSPANARGVDNVDCLKSDLDQIDVIQSCCQEVNSKVDACCTELTSKFDACCTLINNKLDLLMACLSCIEPIEQVIE